MKTMKLLAIIGICLVYHASLAFLEAAWPKELLQKANTSYQTGENTESFQERQSAFNQALSLYQLVADQLGNSVPPGLNLAIGDSYFQLEEYAWAILYYQRALKNDPLNPSYQSRLEHAQNKLGLSLSRIDNSLKNKLLSFFTLSRLYLLLFWITLLTFLLISFSIWRTSSLIRQMSFAFSSILFLLIGCIIIVNYTTPLEAIIIKSTAYYREPDFKQSQLTHQTLVAGSKVRVLQSTPHGDWLKISDSMGLIGYIPAKNIRII